jgi:hypothetical protein
LTDRIGIPRKIIGLQSNLPTLMLCFLHGFCHRGLFLPIQWPKFIIGQQLGMALPTKRENDQTIIFVTGGLKERETCTSTENIILQRNQSFLSICLFQ